MNDLQRIVEAVAKIQKSSPVAIAEYAESLENIAQKLEDIQLLIELDVPKNYAADLYRFET